MIMHPRSMLRKVILAVVLFLLVYRNIQMIFGLWLSDLHASSWSSTSVHRNHTYRNIVMDNMTLPSLSQAISLPKGHVDVIIFMHMAKTGGTTIRDYVKSIPQTQCKLVRNIKLMHRNFARLEQILKSVEGKTKRTTVLELHSGAGLAHYFDPIQRLRKVAKMYQRNMFVFTQVREPVSFHRSYFRYFHRSKCKFQWCEKVRFKNMTDENMLKVARPNHQASVLAGDAELLNNFSSFAEQILETFDWVGTTDEISTRTLPLLSAILTNSEVLPAKNHSNAGASAQVQITDDQTVVSTLHNRSRFDLLLYNWVKETYTLPETLQSTATG